MGRYNFRGDLNKVSDRQLAFIGEVLERKNVKGPDVLLEPVGKVGENYVANVKRITVQENGKTFKIIAKVAPIVEKARETSNSGMLFRNEHVIYTEILPKFDQLQIEAGVPKEERYRYPKCYGSLSEELNEIILLEDLNESGFGIVSRFEPLTNECVNITLKNLAKFHSFSYALKRLEPETYDNFKSKLGDLWTEHLATFFGEGLNVYYEGLEKMASDLMPDNKYKNVIKGTVSELMNAATKCIKSDKNSRYSVIRQGDGWTSNILFRMKNAVPEECVLIDYQASYESSPAYDITYMLFNSTNHDQRLKHYHNFLDLYHSELDKSLNNFGLKASAVYSREQLNADLKRYAKYALSNSIMLLSVILKTPEEAVIMKKSLEDGVDENATEIPQELFEQDPKTALLYKKRVEDLVDSFLEFGLLSENHSKDISH